MNNNSNKFEKPLFKKYYPVPPVYQSIYEYQDINNDINLRKKFTLFFHNKLLGWIDKDSKFKFLHNKKKQISSTEGYNVIYKLLRKFVKKSNINWYDLSDNKNLIKDYLYKSFVIYK